MYCKLNHSFLLVFNFTKYKYLFLILKKIEETLQTIRKQQNKTYKQNKQLKKRGLKIRILRPLEIVLSNNTI